jgi:hypothetical protein
MDARAANMNERSGRWVNRLVRFVRGLDVSAAEHCELCSEEIAPDHSHLAEPAKGRLLCVCRGCAMLLGNREDRKYRLVPEDARRLDGFQLIDSDWEALGIPVGLAFFFHSTPANRVVAFYPGPAGPTESLLDLGAWSKIAADNPVLAGFEPDVEALLVNRVKGARDHYRMPIDKCYALAGLIRSRWYGVSGGEAVWKAIDGFFAGLRNRHSLAGAFRHG